MRTKGEKIPEEWIQCPGCYRWYGFVNCRVSLRNPRRERCLGCAIKEHETAVK